MLGPIVFAVVVLVAAGWFLNKPAGAPALPPGTGELVVSPGANPLPPMPPVEIFDHSELPVELIGTIVRAEPAESVATVRLQNSTVPRRVGEDLFSVAKIKAIRRDRIRILNLKNGHDEDIVLPPYTLSGALAKSQALSEQHEVQVRRSEIDQQLTNVPELLKTARAVPILGADGAVSGFRIESLDPAGFFATHLGLKAGDALMAVNGVKLDGVEAAMKLYNELQNSSLIKLSIERANKTVDVTYLIR